MTHDIKNLAILDMVGGALNCMNLVLISSYAIICCWYSLNVNTKIKKERTIIKMLIFTNSFGINVRV